MEGGWSQLFAHRMLRRGIRGRRVPLRGEVHVHAYKGERG